MVREKAGKRRSLLPFFALLPQQVCFKSIFRAASLTFQGTLWDIIISSNPPCKYNVCEFFMTKHTEQPQDN